MKTSKIVMIKFNKVVFPEAFTPIRASEFNKLKLFITGVTILFLFSASDVCLIAKKSISNLLSWKFLTFVTVVLISFIFSLHQIYYKIFF